MHGGEVYRHCPKIGKTYNPAQISFSQISMPPHSAIPPPAPAKQAASILIARQPIVDGQQTVFGYELYDRTTAADAHTADSDAALLFNALSCVTAETLVDHKTVFINCTLDSLRSPHLELIHPEKVVLEVPPLEGSATAADIRAHLPSLQHLHEQGFRLAFNQAMLHPDYASWLSLAAFIKLDVQAFDCEEAYTLVEFIRAHAPHVRLVAEKIETAAQQQQMANLGVTLFQGYLFARPTVVQMHAVHPPPKAVRQLAELVRTQANIAAIETLLKKEPLLCFNLLRFINVSGLGLACEIASVRHAITILGRKKLFHWARLLFATIPGTPAHALAETEQTAAVRGRLMELLAAPLLDAEECEQAFLVGVFSLLDTLLGMPLKDALDSLSLPEAVLYALLQGQGIFAPLLTLTKACESEDTPAFARAAEALQLSNQQINQAHMQALAWAENDA